MSRYSGPACQARSARSSGSPGKEGGLDRITSNSGFAARAERRFEQRATTLSPRPLARAFSAADRAAFGLMSIATTRGRPGPRSGERQDAGPGAHVGHALARKVEPPDEIREELAGDEPPGVEHGRADDEPESRRPRHPRPAAVEDEVVGEAVDGVAQEAPRPGSAPGSRRRLGPLGGFGAARRSWGTPVTQPIAPTNAHAGERRRSGRTGRAAVSAPLRGGEPERLTRSHGPPR